MTLLKNFGTWIKFLLITKLILYPWIPILLTVFIFLGVNSPAVYADTFTNDSIYFEDFCAEYYGTRDIANIENPYTLSSREDILKDSTDYFTMRDNLKNQIYWETQKNISNHIDASLFPNRHMPDICMPSICGTTTSIKPIVSSYNQEIISSYLQDWGYNPFLSLHLANPIVIANQYALILDTLTNDDDLIVQSLIFVNKLIPNEMWAKSMQELITLDSSIMQFQEKLGRDFNSYNETQKISMVYLRVFINIYNGLLIENKSVFSHLDLAKEIFGNQLKFLLES